MKRIIYPPSTLLGVGGVTGTQILDGTITNSDINAAAAIADSKLAQITTAGKVSGAALTSLSSVPAGAGNIPAANLGNVSIEKSVWLTPNYFYALIGNTGIGNELGKNLDFNNGSDTQYGAYFMVPKGCTAISAIKIFIDIRATGNLYMKFYTGRYDGALGGAITTDENDIYRAYAISGTVDDLAIATANGAAFDGIGAVAAHDVMNIEIFRKSTDALDTYEADLLLHGVRIDFT